MGKVKGGGQPYCPREVRRENGRKVAAAVHGDPERKRLWYLKQRFGSALARGEVSEHTREDASSG